MAKPKWSYIGRAYTVVSDSDPTKVYVLIWGPNWESCTCDGFAIGGNWCKHIKRHRERIARAHG